MVKVSCNPDRKAIEERTHRNDDVLIHANIKLSYGTNARFHLRQAGIFACLFFTHKVKTIRMTPCHSLADV